MKHCNNCDTEKESKEFHKRTASIDGLAARCKPCQKTYDKDRANNPSRVAARQEYAKTDAGIEAVSRARKKWANNNKDRVYKITKSYRENNPKKYRAHCKVRYEVRLGNLTSKPCEVCGELNSVAHHDDYDRPLDIRWLCPKHHMKWHKENGEGLNAK